MTIAEYINSKENKHCRLAILDCEGHIITEDDLINYIEPYNFNVSIRSLYIQEVSLAIDFLYDSYCLRNFEIIDDSETLIKIETEYIEDICTRDRYFILKRPYIEIPTYGIRLENILTVTGLNICCYTGISNFDYDRAADIFYHRLNCSRRSLYPVM